MGSSSPLKICMSAEVIHTVKNREVIASKSEYFASFLDHWQQPSDEALELDPMDHVHPVTIDAFLTALEDDSFGQGFFKDKWTQENPDAFYALWLYFGCKRDLLKDFVEPLSIQERVELLQSAADNGLDVLRLLRFEGFLKDASKLDIPLDRPLCAVSLPVALNLLQCHKHANKQDWSPIKLAGNFFQNARKQFAGGSEKWSKRRLTPQGFAIFLLQTYASEFASSDWDADCLTLVFEYLPVTRPKEEETPQGMEQLVNLALRCGVAIPDMVKNWDLDLTIIATALFEANLMAEASSYPDPKTIVETVSSSWSPEECCSALQEDHGGLERLLNQLDRSPSRECEWLAEISVFVEARNFAQGKLQATLFRVLFLHVKHFDSTLPPSLLEVLPLQDDSVALQSLIHATQYLEHGIDSGSFLILPWAQMASTELLERMVRALHKVDSDSDTVSPLWTCVDLDQLHSPQVLLLVPANRLAQYAVSGQRENRMQISQLRKRVSSLEDKLQKMEKTMKRLEKERYQVVGSQRDGLS